MLPPPPSGAVAFALTLDAADPERSSVFYRDVLGFSQASVHRGGLPFETRVLRHHMIPGVELHIRHSYRRAVTGCAPGTINRISLAEPALHERLPDLRERVTLLHFHEATTDPPRAVHFLDPDGYLIELFVP